MQTDFTLHQLRTFLKVAEFGSVSRAATGLAMPQPAVSRLIARIERNVGVRLLDRSGSGVALTSAGELFRTRALQVVLNHDLAYSDVHEMSGRLYGEARIATPEAVGDLLFVHLIKYFRKQHPDAAVRVLATASASIPTLMDSGLVDIGVIADTHVQPSSNVETLCYEEFYLVGPKGSPETRKQSIPLEAVANLPLVLNAMSGGFRAIIDGAFRERSLTQNVHVEIDANGPLLDLLLANEGFSILPYSTIARKPQLKGLAVSKIVSPTITRHLRLAIATGRPTSAVCREAARQIEKIMKKHANEARWFWRVEDSPVTSGSA